MAIRDLLKRKEKVEEAPIYDPLQGQRDADRLSYDHDAPEFTFLRTTTNTQEFISPPLYPGDAEQSRSEDETIQPVTQTEPSHAARPPSRLRRSFIRHREPKDEAGDALDRRISRSLSKRLHLKSRPESASNIPDKTYLVEGEIARDQDGEAQWEKRATILAVNNPLIDRGTVTQHDTGSNGWQEKTSQRSRSPSISNPEGDETLQEAIRLHEEGDLEHSTTLFGRLADPKGANNALSQVLYGLALRHGWGIAKDEALAVRYLSYAASNSAEIEKLALEAGSKKGGAAKGELTLAIFELANCFRNGWGVARDPTAAKQYYETAANMGDLDAMNEIAWCYVEGFGCKKDKFKAAQYLRLAEERGSKTVGNSWIWKDKYGGPKKVEIPIKKS